MGKVSALADGDVRIADSAAICIYFPDRYPGCGLAPPVDAPGSWGVPVLDALHARGHGTRAVMVGSGVLFMQELDVLPDSERLRAYANGARRAPAYAAAMALDG